MYRNNSKEKITLKESLTLVFKNAIGPYEEELLTFARRKGLKEFSYQDVFVNEPNFVFDFHGMESFYEKPKYEECRFFFDQS